ncbi:hypothetical protein D9613_011152 [Agrocybe pediades]|uniref:BHLH domain-containing protein n=1 Tax=Agrocybe pediades TaxID=84607 RepID=A0A8H4QL35_9AGAR|nr:hypothetical protein D9613_011152 [Agrocybe pediades]
MPKASKESDIYSAVRNPPRRAKPLPPSEPANDTKFVHTSQRSILPMKPYTPKQTSTADGAVIEAPPPAKRGRKPGPLSRAAREAQRRLNHSIIEKARRTKINDALATLRRLVPADYGQQQKQPEPADDEEDDEEDGDYEEGSSKKKAKPKSKATGKKEEKEKEFKLEILERTVTFLQDLLERVKTLESQGSAATVVEPTTCPNCSGSMGHGKKRKRAQVDQAAEEGEGNEDNARRTKAARTATAASENADLHPVGNPTIQPEQSRPSAILEAAFEHRNRRSSTPERLPSISSWLYNPDIDQQLPPVPRGTSYRPSTSPRGTYLPTPPSSTHFDPVRSSIVPPLLNLGPLATAALVSPTLPTMNSSSNRTPEDESAASSLLQIAISPPFLPMSSKTSVPKLDLPDPSAPNFKLHFDGRPHRGDYMRQVQTPSSLLGLNRIL